MQIPATQQSPLPVTYPTDTSPKVCQITCKDEQYSFVISAAKMSIKTEG